MDRAARFGVVLFDDPVQCEGGWASRAGEKAFTIRGAGDLASDVIWLTNLDAKSFYRAGFASSPRFRNADYLRTPLRSIVPELGLNVDEAPDAAASILADVFANVMRVAARFGLKRPPLKSLAAGFHAHYFRGRYVEPRQPEAINAILRDANQPYVFCERSAEYRHDQVFAPIYRHRNRHSMDLLCSSVPWGRWERPEFSRMPRDMEGILRYPRPVLARIVVHRMAPEVAPILAFGATGRDGSPRSWVPQHELRLLARFAEVEIDDMLVAESYTNLPMDVSGFTMREDLSYATGLCMDALWHAGVRNSEDRAAHSAISAWLHASDRILMFAELQRLLARVDDVRVLGFGHGRANVCLPAQGGVNWSSMLNRLTAESSLMPPYCHSREYAAVAPLPENPSANEIVRHLLLSGQRDRILEMDSHLVGRLSAVVVQRAPEEDVAPMQSPGGRDPTQAQTPARYPAQSPAEAARGTEPRELPVTEQRLEIFDELPRTDEDDAADIMDSELELAVAASGSVDEPAGRGPVSLSGPSRKSASEPSRSQQDRPHAAHLRSAARSRAEAARARTRGDR